MIKRILILGAGNAQIDAIRFCKQHGFTVYGCSYTDADRGIPLLDGFRRIDIRDVENVSAYASAIGADAVYSVGSDLAMPTAAAVSERLSLPRFISSETARICQNKEKFRRFLGPDFEGNLPYKKARSLDDALFFDAFPGIMKPVDSQGQRGVCTVRSREEIEAQFARSRSFSASGTVILEQLVDGPEVSVNVYRQDGRTVFLLISARGVFGEYPGGIIKEHLLPHGLSKAGEQRVRDLAERVCAKLKINDGPAYLQIKLDRVREQPYLIEVTPRLDGCHLWRLIRHCCGVDLLETSFLHLLDGACSSFQPRPAFDAYRLRFLCEQPGRVFDRARYDVSGAEYLEWYYETGDTVRPLNGFMEKCGYVIEPVHPGENE
ncbi:ATP-grasp domain-containing protein [Candidatus Soleaferrea massiliensis]|uniref:ATP-grasp domain-containing protein n=1 Tax=Candidatus Soleaferrea massiliensis TaxID=1470354 RepID=UPI00058D0AA1|nr:ATP-grasp domain-containing protein [Candidatus Soleaferrea massiliensis]